MTRDERTCTRASGGFGLVEVLVALAVTAVALAIAAGLLLDARRLLARHGDPVAERVSAAGHALLRADVRSADRVDGPVSDAWSAGPLDLARADGRVVRYELIAGERLVRRLLEPDAGGRGSAVSAAPRGGRVVVREVVGWRWRRPTPRTVEIDLAHLRERTVMGSRRSAAVEEWRRVWVPRGGGLGWGW